MNKIPNPTMILSTPYDVIYVENLEDSRGNALWGQCDYNKARINLTKGMHKALKEKTWLHEVLHGICREINLKTTDNELDNLANVLYDTLIRNKVDFIK